MIESLLPCVLCGDLLSFNFIHLFFSYAKSSFPHARSRYGCPGIGTKQRACCAEWPDNEADVRTYLVNPRARFEAKATELKTDSDKRYPIVSVSTNDAQVLRYDNNHNLVVAPGRLTLIPYYAWDHRGQQGGMEVWLPYDVTAASATPRLSKPLDDNGFFNH